MVNLISFKPCSCNRKESWKTKETSLKHLKQHEQNSIEYFSADLGLINIIKKPHGFRVNMILKLLLVLFFVTTIECTCLPLCSENQCCFENECVDKNSGKCEDVAGNEGVNQFFLI